MAKVSKNDKMIAELRQGIREREYAISKLEDAQGAKPATAKVRKQAPRGSRAVDEAGYTVDIN